MPEPCPSQERWKEHLDGTLPADEQSVLTEHLDGCADCRKTLETLAGGSDSLLDVARQAGEATDAFTRALHEVLAKFQPPPSETQAEPAGARDDLLSFLMPSEKPGSLGRLGHYEVQEVIGKGGFGIVLKAFDEKLHRVVAIKVLSPAYAAIGSARKRFIREAQSAAAVKNEHVVAIYSVKDEAQPPYLVMELIDGMSLQDKLDQKGSLSLKEILRIGMQTAEGLAAAHKQGLVHRDIKPANILLENGVERVRITDFGLARAVDDASMTQSGTVAGTPMYMSPEQAEGLPIDHRSDLFSLGTVLYAMCTGHPPFRASGTHAVLKRVIDASPRPICEINNEIPDWLCAIIAKLHAKTPGERFQTANEVAELLGQHLANVQQSGLAPTPPPETNASANTPVRLSDVSAFTGARPPKKWRWRAAIVGVALCLFSALVLMFAFWDKWFLPPEATINIDLEFYSANLVINGPSGEKRVLLRDPTFRNKHQYTFKGPPGSYAVRALYAFPNAEWEAWNDKVFFSTEFDLPPGGRNSISIPNPRPSLPKLKPTSEPGWVQLFNGKDLTGWKSNEPEKWKVENGSIVGEAVGYLYSSSAYRNFHCRVEVKINAEGAGGLGFRCGSGTGGGVVVGNGFDGRKTGSIYQNSGAKANVVSAWDLDLIKPDTWFVADMIVRGNEVIVQIDGKQTARMMMVDLPEAGGIHVTAQGAGTVIHIRKFEIKELPFVVAPPLAVAPFDEKKAKTHQDTWCKHLGVDVEITNSIGMKLRLIPPGEFLMGSSPEEVTWLLKEVPDLKDASDNVRSEGPPRRVTVKEPFYMGVHEVTVGHFREFVRATKYRTEAETNQGGIIWNNDLKKWDRKPENVWNNVALSGEDTHPVVFVTLADAQAFCAWLTRQEGRAYAVPAEEQWEWACRAGATTHWFFGNDPIAMKDFGWTTPQSEGKLKPVGHLAPNPFGLYDIYGNANELTVNLQQQAVGRGGEAGESPHRARSASRFVIKKQYDPSYRRGFRVVIVGNLKAKTPSSIDQVLKDATLIMNFEKDTFYQREGKTYVRDLSGQGNDGLCDQVEYTPNGQAGGALACKGGALRLRKGLLNKLPEYTVATWINVDFSKETNFRLLTQGAFRDEKEDEPVFGIQVRLTNMFIDSWNRDMQPKKWKFLHLDFPALEPGWNFVAVRLRQGGVGTGELLVTRNDKTLKGNLQMLKADDQIQLMVGYRQPGAVDELVILPRALSDAELQVIYQQGLTKKPLRTGPPSETWTSLFNGKDLTGWTNPKQAFGHWMVENGLLIGKGDQAFLRTERGPYDDFHLRMEAKYVGGSTGLVLREKSPDVAGAGYACSMEDANTGALAVMFTKALLGSMAFPTQALTQRDQWFTLEVIANGNRLQTFVNGKKAVDFVDIHSEFMNGFIGLNVQGKDGELHVKKIEIKKLAPEERGWIHIFNGTDLNGWNSAQRNKWKVEDGAIIGYGSKGYLGSTDNRFENFHLRLEAMSNADGWGGVAFRITGEKHGSVSICPKLGKTGSLYFFNKLLHQPEKQLASPDTWLNLELIVQGKNVVVLVNGTKTAEARIDGLPERGPILLTADAPGTVIRFRKIEIKKLPPTPPAEP